MRVAPRLGTRTASVIQADGLSFKDLNGNGVLDPYEDWRLPVAERVADLVGRMTVEEKAGLMMHATVRRFSGPDGEVLDTQRAPQPQRVPAVPNIRPIAPQREIGPRELLTKDHVRFMLVRQNLVEPPAVTARFSNAVQEIAEGTRLGIPAVFSSDPRHHYWIMPGAPPEPKNPNISKWPWPLGFGALRDPARVFEFATIAATELRALGIRMTLSPSADVATEPRWNRVDSTFGEDPELVAAMTAEYVRGFQGESLGRSSVVTVTKHFPGNGPMKDGWDSHNHYGKHQTYPGGQLAVHERPFEAAIRAGTSAIMPGYGIPDGLDTVGMAYSKVIVTERLRKLHGFGGIVLSDWVHYMPWGLEYETAERIQERMLDAGVDQFGGNNDPRIVVELVRSGVVPEARLDESVARILTVMFEIGLFEDPYVDPDDANSSVASEARVAAGAIAQRESVVLLKNEGCLPLSGRPRLYVENMDRDDAAAYGEVVSRVEDADVAIIGVTSPYVARKDDTPFFAFTKEGPLCFAGADTEAELHAIARLAASGKPTVVCIRLERPAILSEFIEDVDAVLAHFTSSDAAIFDVLFGKTAPRGKLPFDLPRDMASVEKQRSDVPFDLENPLFRFGFGLTYPE